MQVGQHGLELLREHLSDLFGVWLLHVATRVLQSVPASFLYDNQTSPKFREVNLGNDCFGVAQKQKRFRALRNQTCEFCDRSIACT